MSKFSGVYKIQSICKPERVYIGSAVNIRKRWYHHDSNLRLNKHHSPKLQSHYNKYHKEDLEYSILMTCDKKDLIYNEQLFIDQYNPYFNINKKADSRLGMAHTKETKEKLRLVSTGRKQSPEAKKKQIEAQIGKPCSEETRIKIGNANRGKIYGPISDDARRKRSEASRGRKMSEEAKIKISNSLKGRIKTEEERQKMRGRKMTDEHKEKLRLSHLGKKQSPETIEKRVSKLRGRPSKITGRKTPMEVRIKMMGRIPANISPVIQLDLNGNIIREWRSITDAAETLKISHISSVLHGKRNHAGGYLWKFKNVA